MVAQIVITDQNGRMLRQGSLKVDGGTLAAGA
jgi:F420-0:gamma-glutamyl ligase